MIQCSCSGANMNPAHSTSNHLRQPIPSLSAHYEDPFLNEPIAPTFSLGDQVFWLNGDQLLPCTIRWIGRIPQLYRGWAVGVEFAEPVEDGGDGSFRGRHYFSSAPQCALFLPSEELTTESSDAVVHPLRINGYQLPHCHQEQEMGCRRCSPSYRDSTYGHYKHCCNLPPSRNLYQCGGPRGCENVPIYGRISVRQALHSNNEPQHYESCYVQNSPDHVYSYACPGIRPRHSESIQIEQPCSCCSQVGNHYNQRERETRHEFDNYTINEFSPTNLQYREPLINPRSTLRLINGFKEWVSCWIFGTSRRKKERNIVVRGRRSVASFFLADTANSMSRTGKRLSSFGDYSSIEVSSTRKALESNNRVKANIQNARVLDDAEENNAPISAAGSGVVSRNKRYKKRPAPLPPNQQNSNSKPPLPNNSRTRITSYNTDMNDRNIKKVTGSRKEKRFGNSMKSRHRHNKDQAIHLAEPDNSTDQKVRRSPKKTRAPLPPLPRKTNQQLTRTNTTFTLNGPSKHQVMVTQSDRSSFRISPKYTDFADGFMYDDDGWVIIPPFAVGNEMFSGTQVHVSPKENSRKVNDDSYSNEVNGTNSRRQSVSFSAEEDSENEINGGIMSYQKKRIDERGESSVSDISTQFVKKNDKLLKISISKTEMNVLTVEEFDQTSDTSEEDSHSTLSECSNNSKNDQTRIFQDDNEGNDSGADSVKSSSSDELPSPADNKPIFEELKLSPPSKASVKDFVNAFNMLATRDHHVKHNYKNESATSALKSHIEQKPKDKTSSSNNNKLIARDDSIKSFPTKWQFQWNNAEQYHGAKSRFLLPIEEESHDSSGCENDPVKTKKANVHGHHQSNVANAKSLKDDDRVVLPMTKGIDGDKNQIFSSAEQVPPFEKKDNNITRVSDAALSMLSGKSEKGLISGDGAVKPKKFPLGQNATTKDSKKDQPIVVSLYIEDKSSHRGPIPFIVKPSMSLWKLKKKVEKEYGFDKNLQCWILGETFAIHDDASLASYGVQESGCPILLYVMSVDSRSLPLRYHLKSRRAPIYDDVTKSSSESGSEDVIDASGITRHQSSSRNGINDAAVQSHHQDKPGKIGKLKALPKTQDKSVIHVTREVKDKKKDYHALLELDDVDLVKNIETFECTVCFMDIEPGKGAILQECLHSFCRVCLAGVIEFSETAMVKCPFRNDEYSCDSHLQEREIKSLVSPEVFERHLQRGMKLAESQALNSFHCKTPDCQGWCLYEDNVNTFFCPVCKRTNCLTCAAIHEGKNCRQYQDHVSSHCDSSEEAKKTKEYLENMVKDGDAMKCPKCEVILMKKWGCDWLKCSMCHTEVCWVTKGPRWGPAGRGDTSGGCKCMLEGVRCHPKCSYCH